MFTLCTLLRDKNKIQHFPTILDVNPPCSLEAGTCYPAQGFSAFSVRITLAAKFTRIKNSQPQAADRRGHWVTKERKQVCASRFKVNSQGHISHSLLKQTCSNVGDSSAQWLRCGLRVGSPPTANVGCLKMILTRLLTHIPL